ncbi:hypothetical protein [Enterococcus sp. BWR-S5]|uniref:hypothetical protein n=1 Tax=Enterococcus sp. BWR-S5 TaxID=2787714 RepID=UPI001922A38A|nr:hypothetical protein [Enterococcus sp. BWR-S5]MBL1226495.1 hypothetical protein [Enterococcus sp. BWR-S5]
MGVAKLYMEPSVFGTALMQQHVRTIFRGTGRNRVAEFEVFEVATEKAGKVEVRVPVEKAMKGIRYGVPVELIGIWALPRSVVNNVNGSKRAKVEFDVLVEDLKVKEGI